MKYKNFINRNTIRYSKGGAFMIEGNDNKIWKKFLREHWQICVLFIVIAVFAAVGAIYVFLSFIGDAQLTGLIPETLGVWSMGYIVTFMLHLIFWEALFIGIPVVIVIAVIYFGWWKKLPEAERKEYKDGHLFGKRSTRSDGSGFISFLVFIVFIIKIWLDGNWGVAIATWEFDYLVHTCLWALVVVLVIFGIPMLIGGTWWIRHEMKK